MSTDIQLAFDGLKRKHEALITALVASQKENDMLKSMNNILSSEKKQWVEQKEQQDRIMQQQLQINDSIVRNLQDEIISIKNRNRQ